MRRTLCAERLNLTADYSFKPIINRKSKETTVNGKCSTNFYLSFKGEQFQNRVQAAVSFIQDPRKCDIRCHCAPIKGLPSLH